MRGPWGEFVNFHPNRGIRGVNFHPNRSIKFHKNDPKRVAKYENFTNMTQRMWLKTKKLIPNRSIFYFLHLNTQPEGLKGGTSLLTLTEGVPPPPPPPGDLSQATISASYDMQLFNIIDPPNDDGEITLVKPSPYHGISSLPSQLREANTQFNILSFNSQSLNAKFDGLQILLETTHIHTIRFHVICIQETTKL